MRINNQNISQNNKQNFKALSKIQKPLGQFYNANATIPTLVIETGVTLGRAYEANKRGGTPEMVDRLVEQGVGALVWIYGVKALKNIGDFLGKKLLNIDNLNFDIGFDELRNPIKNNNLSKKLVGFKACNILLSTALATVFMGSILPKINNAILRKTTKKNQKQDNDKTTKMPSFEDYKKQTQKNISFTSLYDKTVGMAHVLENNSTARLFITDTGVVAGRFHNAQNKYRKIEGLFRDISSIYFYLFSTPQLVKLLNKLSTNTSIDPKALEKTVELLSQQVNQTPQKWNDFETSILGEETEEVKQQLSKLKTLFKDKKTISVDDFIEHFPSLQDKAISMAKLQPIFEGNGILSEMEAKDVISNSKISNPEFLKKMFSYVTDGKSDDKMRYVSRKNLEKIRTSITSFTKQIVEKAKKENAEIDEEFIKKIAKSNLRKNFIFNLGATGISIFALGILIPKVQYWITKKLTNENKFHTEEE